MSKKQTREIIEYNFETERLYLRHIISSPSAFVRCQNILKPEYWTDTLRPAARFILKHVSDYAKLPTSDQVQAQCNISLPPVENADTQEDWFLNSIEAFCRHKAMEHLILDGPDLIGKGLYAELERRSKENMMISLQKELGTDYFSDPLKRLQRMKDRTGMRSTGWKDIDDKLYGGFNRGEISIFVGGPGCVTYDTPVHVVKLQNLPKPDTIPLISDYSDLEKFEYLLTFYSGDQIEAYAKGSARKLIELWNQTQPIEKPIGELKDIKKHAKYFVDSPDGWVRVINFVKKPIKLIFQVTMTKGPVVKASFDHLFQKKNLVWANVNQLEIGDLLITSYGIDSIANIEKYGFDHVYDLSVDHPNHRYFTNKICSHNTGKSLFLQNLALNWVQQGLNIIYITLELSEDLIGLRYDAMITTFPTKHIFKNSEEAALTWGMIVKSNKWGQLQIKSMPGAGTTANDIRAYIKEYEIQTGVKVDGLVVDYLDLIYPNVGNLNMSDLFVKDKFTSEELRALAAELNILVATASQLNRNSIQEQNFDASHIAGGISKFNTADNVMAIFTSSSLRERGEYQIQFLKTRSSSGVGSKVSLSFNVENMRITNFDGVISGGGGTSHTSSIQKQIAAKKPTSNGEAVGRTHDTPSKIRNLASSLRNN